MKCLGTIRERDVYPDRKVVADSEYTKTREAVRFVIFDENNCIALNHRPKQQGYEEQHAIPGGGVEVGETIEEALQREAREETGCEIIDITEVGYIMEYGVSPDLVQKTHVFTAKVLKKHEPKYTESEIASNLSVVWVPFSEARKVVQDSTDSFAKTRSLVILHTVTVV